MSGLREDKMRTLICAAAALSVLWVAPAAGQDELYKWVDEDGNVSYQDSPPPEDSGQVQTFSGQSDESVASTLPDVDVVLYAIGDCDACDMARNLLNERGVPFQEKDAEGGAEIQAELREVAGVLSVPVVTIGDEVLTGYNRGLIVNELEEAGFEAGSMAAAETGSEGAGSAGNGEGMTPEEMEQAARDIVSSDGGGDDPLQEDDGFSTFSEDLPGDGGSASDDITQLEEIPENERIRVGE